MHARVNQTKPNQVNRQHRIPILCRYVIFPGYVIRYSVSPCPVVYSLTKKPCVYRHVFVARGGYRTNSGIHGTSSISLVFGLSYKVFRNKLQVNCKSARIRLIATVNSTKEGCMNQVSKTVRSRSESRGLSRLNRFNVDIGVEEQFG